MKELGKGTIGHQNFYTRARAMGDLYSLARGVVDTFAVKFPNGSTMDVFKNEKSQISYVYSKVAGERGETVTFPLNEGHAYKQVEKALDTCMEAAGYDEGELLGAEDIALQLLEKGISVSNYNSDLYVPLSPDSSAILEQYQFANNVSTFNNQASGEKELMFEVPFAFDAHMYQKIRDDLSRKIPSALGNEENQEATASLKL